MVPAIRARTQVASDGIDHLSQIYWTRIYQILWTQINADERRFVILSVFIRENLCPSALFKGGAVVGDGGARQNDAATVCAGDLDALACT